jgi:deoxyribodipyrimidine photolyase-related protein
VRHVVADSYADGIRACARDVGPLRAMVPAERELRVDVPRASTTARSRSCLTTGGSPRARTSRRAAPTARIAWTPSTTASARAPGSCGSAASRRGKSSAPTPRTAGLGTAPPAPEWPRFAVDDVTAEVGALIAARYAHHPGRLDLAGLPATRDDVEAHWRFALAHCLPSFGPFEDAM